MSNSIAFSVGGSGGGSAIKSIQKISVSLGDVDITTYRYGTGTFIIDVPIGRTIDPDKSIVILPQHIIGMNSRGTKYTIYSTTPLLYEIAEDQITILLEQTTGNPLDTVSFVADVYNIIQIIEFE